MGVTEIENDRHEPHNLLLAQKKLRSEIIHILQSHYPPSDNVHVILLKFEMATTC